MDTHKFNSIVGEFYKSAFNLLKEKGKGYEKDNTVDRLGHFKRAAIMSENTPEQALKGMWVKQLTSIMDFIKLTKIDPNKISMGEVEERLRDSINYHGILYAMLVERMMEVKNAKSNDQNSN